MGFVAFALADIFAGFMLCEYTGELCYLNDQHDETLSFGFISYFNKEVGLVTDKFANEGRFFSGVSPDC